MLAGARHRARQFFGALRPHVDDEARRQAYTLLSDAQRQLFETMTLRDQQHGIEVFQRVRVERPGDTALFVAALLHDCGKGDVRLWQRVAFVMLAAATPRLLSRIVSKGGARWRQAFWRLLHHPDFGGDLVAGTGADPEVVRMIREQDSAAPADARLAVLQAADEA